jgi:multidrug efflux pump subunit AcrB
VGAVALLVTPREEDPQIVVPLANVMISYPGGSAEEVENLVAARLERLLYQIDGVEYVYSMSRPGQAVVTVRFYVGQDREESLIKLYNKIFQNLDKTTPGIAGWVVKPVEIDDVPVVSVTLYSDRYDTHQLYRVAEEAVDKLQHVKDTSTISIHGGQPRVVNIYLDAERLSAHGLSALELAGALKASNAQLAAGTFEQGNASVRVETGPFLQNAREVMNLVVGLHDSRPVYLRDVARLEDGPAEVDSYTRIGFGPANEFPTSNFQFPIDESERQLAIGNWQSAISFPAVTIAVAKKRGSNAVSVTREVQEAVEQLRGTVIPDDVQTRVTRDYGATADEKVNDLVKNLIEAIITVIALIAIVMNWRLGLIVAFAVPITYALTLLVNLLAGYTINRVTLFALILALGLLVDDPIVAVENIYRHLSLRKQNKLDAIGSAMREIMQPVTLATLSVIAAFLPMFFITGMMGPYMRPMALNVPLAMLSSLLVSFAITPWLSSKMLKEGGGAGHDVAEDVKTGKVYRFYARMVGPFLASRARARGLLWVTAGLFAGSLALALGVVPLKMLPFDNKNEFQMVVDMPESSTLEKTDAVIRDLEAFLRTQPEVTAFTTYAGTASPMDFNGLVRHYYLRRGPHVGEIRVNLLHRKEREASSHEIVLRIRNEVDAIARRHGANVKLVEIPPGPPVLSTVVAEVYGQPHHTYADLVDRAAEVAARMREEKGVVDVDVSAEDASAPAHLCDGSREGGAERHFHRGGGPDRGAGPGRDERGHAACAGRAERVVPDPAPAPGSPLGRGRPGPPAHQGAGWRSGSTGRTGSLRDRRGGAHHLPQEPGARGVCDGGDGGRRPGVPGAGPAILVQEEPGARRVSVGVGGGRRVEDHRGCVPRPRPGLRGRPAHHLYAAGLRDRVLRVARGDYAVHPADHDRHHARLLHSEPAGQPGGGRVCQPGVLHRHGHDRYDRAGRHRGPQRHHLD